MATLQNTTVNGTLSTNQLTVNGGIGSNGNINNTGNVNVALVNNTAVLRTNGAQMHLSRESSNRGPLPLSWLSNTTGQNLHSDQEFASGNNGVGVYNNTGSGAVIITRETGTNVPNSTGIWLRINTQASGDISPSLGGWRFGDGTKANALYVCYFTALCPVGYTIGFHSNSIGSGGYSFWATNNVGTGKWEQYTYVVQAGNGGNSSTFFFALSGGPRPVTWYLARAVSYRIG